MNELATRTLEDYEAVIERGLETFFEVGVALTEIRDARLYRESFETFEDYCRERWDFSDSRARQLVAAAETVTTVTVEGLPAPRNESVARELAPLRREPEQLREVWTETVEHYGDRPTAAQVREVVQQHPATTSKPEPEFTQCPTCGHRLRRDKPRPVEAIT